MNDIQKKTYIDKDETDSMERNKQMKKKQIVCTYKDKQGLQAVYNIINDNFVTNYTDKNE